MPERTTQLTSPPSDAAGMDALLGNVDELMQRVQEREEENLRLVDEVLQSYEQLNILFEVTKASSELRSANEIHDLALVRLGGALQASFACVLDKNGGFQRTAGHYLADAAGLEVWKALVERESGRGLQSACGQSRVCQVSSEHHSLLVIPLLMGTEVRGAALFVRPINRPFHTGDQAFAQTVMGQVAQTAHNIELFNDLQEMSVDVVRAMVTAIDAKDDYTSGHSERVAQWSVLLGRELGLSTGDLQLLEWGGRLHDVGKIGIRDDVLGKQGPLTPEEFEHIKLHPVISYEVLRPIRRLAPILDGVRHHHEAWDGSGYPDGLAGERIPLMARVIQTADVFDALTSSRSYRPAYSVNQALEIMRKEGGRKLDASMVSVFIQVVGAERQRGSYLLDHIPDDLPTETAPAGKGAAE